ncbi:MAG: ABC transporter permease [Solirubrobacteraceae bacterium]
MAATDISAAPRAAAGRRPSLHLGRARPLLRRLVFYVITAWIAVTFNFLIPRLMPGNAVDSVLSRLQGNGPVTPRAIHALELAFGLHTHQTPLQQYVGYLGSVVQGNFGTSIYYYPSSVASVIGNSLPWTVALVGVSTIIAFVLGTALGVLAGWKRGSRLDALVPAGTLLSAMPYFWVGLILISVFATSLHWLPFFGGSSSGATPSFTLSFLGNAAYHAILPGVTIVVSAIGGWLLGMRNMVVSILAEDYIVLAEAKGLPSRRVIGAYVTRNAILPNISGFALSLGFVVAGSIVTEVVFNYPGIGNILFQAVSARDYPLMQGIFLIITLVVLLANLFADAVYVLLDPRTREA